MFPVEYVVFVIVCLAASVTEESRGAKAAGGRGKEREITSPARTQGVGEKGEYLSRNIHLTT